MVCSDPHLLIVPCVRGPQVQRVSLGPLLGLTKLTLIWADSHLDLGALSQVQLLTLMALESCSLLPVSQLLSVVALAPYPISHST